MHAMGTYIGWTDQSQSLVISAERIIWLKGLDAKAITTDGQ